MQPQKMQCPKCQNIGLKLTIADGWYCKKCNAGPYLISESGPEEYVKTQLFDKDAQNIEGAIRQLADAIFPSDLSPGKDATGGMVGSLSEATMGITAGLARIADAITYLADSVREQKE